MQQKYSVIIDWGVPLEISGDSVRLLRAQQQVRREEEQIMRKTIKDEIGKKSELIQKKETSAPEDNKSYPEEKIIWRDQTYVIDSCVKLGIPPAGIVRRFVDRGYYRDENIAMERIKRHLRSDTQSKREKRNIVTSQECRNYLRKFNLPMPKYPYS